MAADYSPNDGRPFAVMPDRRSVNDEVCSLIAKIPERYPPDFAQVRGVLEGVTNEFGVQFKSGHLETLTGERTQEATIGATHVEQPGLRLLRKIETRFRTEHIPDIVATLTGAQGKFHIHFL